jgi:hypothetical protein
LDAVITAVPVGVAAALVTERLPAAVRIDFPDSNHAAASKRSSTRCTWTYLTRRREDAPLCICREADSSYRSSGPAAAGPKYCSTAKMPSPAGRVLCGLLLGPNLRLISIPQPIPVSRRRNVVGETLMKRQRAGGSAGLNRSTGSAARLGNRALGVGISTTFLSALLVVASAHTVRAAGVVGTGTAGSCVGDCDSSGEVTVNELIILVNIALGSADNSACPHGIPAAATVDISLIIQAVNNALNGCPAPPASPTPIVTPTVTPIPSRFVDNGDGTITDTQTDLMWEKKIKLDGTGDTANLDDADNCYPWTGNCMTGGAACSVNADCGANGPCQAGDCQMSSPNGLTIFQWVAQLNTANFGGHNDWRIPNVNELHSIVDYSVINPSVAAAFQGASCGGACTDITSAACSCTVSDDYWSSSTLAPFPAVAWLVVFNYGSVGYDHRTVNDYVRAVRGGL